MDSREQIFVSIRGRLRAAEFLVMATQDIFVSSKLLLSESTLPTLKMSFGIVFEDWKRSKLHKDYVLLHHMILASPNSTLREGKHAVE